MTATVELHCYKCVGGCYGLSDGVPYCDVCCKGWFLGRVKMKVMVVVISWPGLGERHEVKRKEGCGSG